jgi:hypothetical protein
LAHLLFHYPDDDGDDDETDASIAKKFSKSRLEIALLFFSVWASSVSFSLSCAARAFCAAVRSGLFGGFSAKP